MKIVLPLACLLLFGFASFGQINRIETSPTLITGQVPGYSEVSSINTKTISYTPSTPPIDPTPIDNDSTTEVLKEYKYADVVAVNITLLDGNITNTSVGKVWTLKISIPNALNVGFVFNQFNLHSTAEMYIFNESRTVMDTAIKMSHFSASSRVSVFPFVGSSAIIYIVEPGNFGSLLSNVAIQKVQAGFQEIQDIGAALARTSVGCDPSIRCQPARLYNGRAVAQWIVNGVSGTGTLLNNENNDGRAFFLTAFHVLDQTGGLFGGKDGFLDASEIDGLQDALFIFQYWKTTCAGTNIAAKVYFSGATLRGQQEYTDAILLELNNPPGIGDGVNYAGWSRQTSAPADYGCYILHHPQSQDMRITSTRKVNSWVWNSQYWNAKYNDGTVDRGSSGSALFNENGLVVGQLRSGWSSCVFTDFGDRYGKLDGSWNVALQPWLSPSQNLSSVPPLIISPLTISGGDYFSCPSPDIPFSVPDLTGCSYTWTHSSNLLLVSGQGTATAIYRSISSLPNDYGWISVTITDSKGHRRTASATKQVQMGIPFLFPPPVFKNSVGGEGFFCSSHTGNYFEITPVGMGVTYQYRIRDAISNNIVYTAPGSYPAGTISVSYIPPTSGWYLMEIKVNSPCGTADWEAFEVEYLDCTLLDSESSLSMTIAPNPASSFFHLTIEERTDAKVVTQRATNKTESVDCVLYDVQQARVSRRWTFQSSQLRYQLDVSGIKPGQYLLVVTRGGQRVSKQVVIR